MRKRIIGALLAAAVLSQGCVLRGKRHLSLDAQLGGHQVSAAVTVVYDANGVPHVEAESDADLYYGLGYAMAQDRFFYMDLMRKVGRGETCRLFGRPVKYKAYDFFTVDRLMRTFDYGARSRASVSELAPEDREVLAAYARGVNRYLADAGRDLPEYRALHLQPDPWAPEDSFVCMEVYGLSMTLWGLFHEYYLDRLTRELGPERAKLFFLEYPADAPYINQNELAGGDGLEELGRLLDAFAGLGLVAARVGSNNWVVDGTMTASGKPILANDPHVPHLIAPTFWYHAHLSGGSYDAAGLMFSGIPLMGAGTNGRLAWGITNARCDYIDLFRERVNPDNPDQYWHKDGWREFERRDETVRVRGGLDKKFSYRRSVHGPVIEPGMSGVNSPVVPGQALSLHLAEIEGGRFFRGYLAIPRSKNAGEIKEAIRDMSMGPVAWNTVYASGDGDIGYLYSGHAALRPDNQGVLPRSGEGGGEWRGWVPFDELPHIANPAKRFLVTANNKVEPPGYPYYLCSGYNLPSRAERIQELLAGRSGLTARDMQQIQLDVHVKSAERFVRVFLTDLAGSDDPDVILAAELLAEWAGQIFQATLDSRGTAVYKLMMKNARSQTFNDELGKKLAGNLSLAEITDHAMWKILPEEDNIWFDWVDTPERETRRDISREAARESIKYLRKNYGRDPGEWQWGRAQRLFMSTALGFLPWNREAALGTRPLPGTEESVNNASAMFIGPIGYLGLAGPSSRIVVDLARPREILFTATTGNSESPDSPFFGLTTADWFEGRYRTLSLDPETYRRGAMATLKLGP